MMSGSVWAVIVGMALANFTVRFVPLALLSRLHLPVWAQRWLAYIPVSVMATLVAGEVLRPGGSWQNPLSSPYLWAAAVTGLVYWKSRSFLGATLAGIVSFLVFRAALG
jgi:branched-subunit amino acid transport protein